MSLQVGIVGLPNAGKSTLFNALLGRQLARVAEYPFTTIEPHEGVVDVPDQRLVDLALLVKPETVTPTTVTFVDIAGLVKGAHQGEGLGNEFLGHIRTVSAILLVVRAFAAGNIPHPMNSVDPDRDVAVLETELLLADLATVDRRMAEEKDPAQKAFWGKVAAALDQGTPARRLALLSEESHWLTELSLLTAKPQLNLLNVSEADLGSPMVAEYRKKGFMVVCAKLEADLLTLAPSEQREYLSAVGVGESSLTQLIKKAYQILNLITFYTIKGGREVRAWTLRQGSTAFEAAAAVHTDFARGFIKAEVIPVTGLFTNHGWYQAHVAGKIRLEGRDYVVADGDVVEFKAGSKDQ